MSYAGCEYDRDPVDDLVEPIPGAALIIWAILLIASLI